MPHFGNFDQICPSYEKRNHQRFLAKSMANLAIHHVLWLFTMYSGFPSKIFHLPEKLTRHPSTGKNGDKEANKPVKEKERKEKERKEKERDKKT